MKTIILALTLTLLLACSNGSKDTTAASTTEVLETKTTETLQKAPKVVTEATLDLTRHGIANNPNNVLGGLKVGELAPDIELENQDGKVISLDSKLKEGPVLLVFYRADWCSICRRHLAEFEDKIKDIHTAGAANVIAVSPQKKEYSRELRKANNYSFPILFDEDHQTMKDYKVFFHATEKYNQYILEAKGDPIEVRNGDTDPVMPVPATYLIGQDKKLKYVHYDPNYRERADLSEVLKAIESQG